MDAFVVRKIPLNKLVLSLANVRKTPASAAEDAELKASLRAAGLKQNLVVHPAGDEKGVHAVVAGGRRLKALQELAAEGVIAEDYKVPCLVEDPEEAIETSLMENAHRAAMSPADEFVAMADLIDAGHSVEAVATRFGVTEKHVRQRLRLGKVASEILDQYRAEEISLDIVMAFTLGADQDAQRAVWRQVKDQPYLAAHTVRRLLTESAVSVNSRLGAFVGIDAYEAAGGSVTRDLFSDRDEGYMDDAGLVHRLAMAKLEAKAEELRQSWSWAKAVLDLEYGFASDFGRVYPNTADVPAAIAEELQRIEQRQEEIEASADDEWTDELADEADRLEERRTELNNEVDALAVYSDDDRAKTGCIVTIGDQGEFKIHEGLVERSASGSAGGDDDDVGDDDSDLQRSIANGKTGAPSAEVAMRKECGFSQSLVDDLKAHRLQITQAHLAGDYEVAFDLALYSMCVDILQVGYRTRPVDLKTIENRPRSSLNDLADTPAAKLLEARRERLDVAWLKLPASEGFKALSALSPEAKQRLFAWCVAMSLKSQLGIEDNASGVVEEAGRRLVIPFAEFWRPTAANYWARVKKAHGLEVGGSILGSRWARDHASEKKATLAAALERAFDPAANVSIVGLEDEARLAASTWVAPGMTYAERLGGTFEDDDIGDVDGSDAEEAADEAAGESEKDSSSELPAFLTADEPDEAHINGAA